MINLNVNKIIDDNQYVVCEIIWDESVKRYKKIPVNPSNVSDRQAVKDSKPLYPLFFDIALYLANEYNEQYNCDTNRYFSVGYVLNEQSNLFCIDLDNFHRIPEYILDNFSQAQLERSVSGKGWHLWGKCAEGVPDHKKTSNTLGVELYSRQQFIALGDYVLGEINEFPVETVNRLIEYYGFNRTEEKSDILGSIEWTNEPQEGYYPGDIQTDVDVLEYLTKQRGKTAVNLLNPSAKDVSFFRRFYTPDTCLHEDGAYSPYQSRSELDQSVIVDLLYATGGNCQRVLDIIEDNEFFFRSEKHSTYLARSITNGLRLLMSRPENERFLAFKKAKQIEENKKITEDLMINGYSEVVPTAEILTLDDMLEQYVYIEDGGLVYDLKSKTHLKYAEKKSATSASTTIIESSKTDSFNDIQRVIKTYPTLDLWLKNPQKQSVHNFTFEPVNAATVYDKGVKRLNTYSKPVIDESYADYDITHFHNHIAALFKDRADDFLDWCAHMVQKPHELPHIHWLHVSDKGGTGRGRLCNLLKDIVEYGHAVTCDMLFSSAFNDFRGQMVFGFIEEMVASGGSKGRTQSDVYNSIKDLTTPDKVWINNKGVRRYEVKNFARWFFCSNTINAIKIPKEDRRLEVVVLDDEEGNFNIANGRLESFYTNENFIKAVRYFLSQRDISRFNYRAHAKPTEDRNEVIRAGSRLYAANDGNEEHDWFENLRDDVMDFLEEYEGPDLMSTNKIMKAVRPCEVMLSKTAKSVVRILHSLKCKYTDEQRYFYAEDYGEVKTQKHIWILRNKAKWKLKLKDSRAIVTELEKPLHYKTCPG